MSIPSFSLRQSAPFILVITLSAVYLKTICPTVYLGDSGELATAAFSLGIPHNSGYPLYNLIGKIFCMIPIGNIGFRMNLMSTCFAVLTIWLIYSIIYKITCSIFASVVASLSLAFTTVFWSQSVAAEVYPLHSFFVTLLIRLLYWWDERREFALLMLFVFITGISFGNHMQTVMLAPAVLFIVLSGDKKALFSLKNLLVLSFFFLLALSLYLYLPIRTDAGAAIHWGDPNTFERFFAHVTARAHRGGYVLTKGPLEYLSRTKEMLWFVSFQFGAILIFAIWGWLKLQAIRWRIFFVGIIIFDFAYAIFLNIISLEITAFTIPTSLVVSILFGLGIADILKVIESHNDVIRDGTQKMIKAAFGIIPVILFLFNLAPSDQGRNYTAYEHAANIFRTLNNGSTLFIGGDNNVFPVLYGRIVERMREDVTLYDRYSLFFKMPYEGDDGGGHFKFYGKWEDLRSTLEQKIIEKRSADGVFFAFFNPYSISLPGTFRLVPFGILFQVLGDSAVFDIKMANKIWGYYATESYHDDFTKDYMNREVSSYFYFKKGKYYLTIGAPDIGLKYLRLASDIGYNDDMIHSDMALLFADHGFFKEARSELEKALVYNDDKSGVHNNWGYYYSKLNDFKSAIVSFHKAIELNPNIHSYYNNLAFCLYKVGKREDALQFFQKSLAIKGNQPAIKKIIKENGLGLEASGSN